MRILATLIGMVLALAVGGCDQGEETKAPEPKAAEATEEPAGEKKSDPAGDKVGDVVEKSKAGEQVQALKAKGDALKASLEDKAPPLTPERYEELVLALASCELKDRSIDAKCEQLQALQKAKQNKASLLKDFAGMHAKLGRKHLGHESATVRWYAAGLMGSGFANGVAKEDVVAIVEAGKKEADPIVLARMAREIGSSHGKDPSAGKFLIEMTRNQSDLVRKEALSNLATWGKQTKGVVPAFRQAILKDESAPVRAYACERAGELGQEKLLPVMQKLAMKKKTDPEIYTGCFKGIIQLWTKYPFAPEKPSRKAYLATLKLLKAKPRSEERPPWTVVSTFSGLKKPDDKWVKKAKFYKKPAFFKALSTVVTDKKTNWMTRTGFVKLMAELEAPKPLFARMHKAYKKAEGSDTHVVKALDKALGKTE